MRGAESSGGTKDGEATTMIDEKDRHISDLEDKVRTLEKRLEGTTLTGDEHIQALVEEVGYVLAGVTFW
ncbi:hypothetical protein HPB51_024603 [Rhipicephalus microplus]|uniref:Uncharacterized protein n=1 Tax=Rhipicephalus microplus TaxID=6941 RepID=A0A9J6ED42_RHIMP|nr:hypothetical protein HPB51_024603 [Rhipicephalus microplus]